MLQSASSVLHIVTSLINHFSTSNQEQLIVSEIANNIYKENHQEKSVFCSLKELSLLLLKHTSFPVIICNIIAQYTISHSLKVVYPDNTSAKMRTEHLSKIYNFDSYILKSILQSQKGFKIGLQCILPTIQSFPTNQYKPYRLLTIKSMTQKSSPYLSISTKVYNLNEMKLLIYMRSLHRENPEAWINDHYDWGPWDVGHKSMLFNINTNSINEFKNKMVCMDLSFQWIQNKGYKITISSDELQFIHFNRDRIANVKHLSLRSLENVTVINGRKKKYFRTESQALISVID